MKHLVRFFLAMLLLGRFGQAQAQTAPPDGARQQLDQIFAPLDKSQVPSGYLDEYGERLLGLRPYNGTLTDSNRLDLSAFRFLRATIFSALVAGTDTLPSVPELNRRLTARRNGASGAPNPIAVQFMGYDRIRGDALQHNLLTVQNEQVSDVAGRAQNPYQTNVLFAAAPTISRARTNTVSFRFRRNLYLTGNGAAPGALYLDFGDGNGYRPAAWEQVLTATYATAGTKRVKVKFVYELNPLSPSGTTRQSSTAQSGADQPTTNAAPPRTSISRESWFDFEVWSVAPAARTTGTPNCAICDDELPFNASGNSGREHSGGTAFVIYGKNAGGVKHTQLTKPFIISEGYNLYDIAEELRKCNNPNNDIDEFFRKIDISFRDAQGNITGNFRTSLQNAGYDIVYIDNAKGTDDIVRNAHLFEDVVELRESA